MADVGIKFSADGYSEFKKNLADCQQNLKVLGSGLKEVKSQFDKNDSSVSALTKKNEALDKSIKAQKDQVDLLAKGVKEATSKWGENDRRTQDLIIKYNNAKSSLNSLEREYKSNASEIEKMGNKSKRAGELFSQAGEKAKAFGNSLKSGLAAAAKIGVASVAAVGAGIAAIATKSIASYSEYEQLVGGVDTLFGDSSKKVQQYASDAYKTAGMSANQYMSTVTSFSASLLQSLGGDTGKAAEAANSALIDMSDNANKMGTDMESVQNAYQGFAKGNYTINNLMSAA